MQTIKETTRMRTQILYSNFIQTVNISLVVALKQRGKQEVFNFCFAIIIEIELVLLNAECTSHSAC